MLANKFILFEDAEDAAISRLIKYAYRDEENVKVVFAGGKDVLQKKLDDNYIEGGTFIVFIDMIPDNYDTVKTCRKLVKTIRRRKYRNVFIIPSICTEYYCLRAFINEIMFTDEVELALNKGAYWLRSSAKNFENYCKEVLESVSLGCMHTDIEGNYDAGVFYEYSCKYKNFDRNLKAWMLLREFPVVYGSVNNKLATSVVKIYEVQVKAFDEFYSFVKKYIELGRVDFTEKAYMLSYEMSKNNER